MHPRRPILKRVAVWTAGFVVAFALYVAGAPMVVGPIERQFPAAIPILNVVYAPLVYVARDPDAPGHDLFLAYAVWCDKLLREVFGL